MRVLGKKKKETGKAFALCTFWLYHLPHRAAADINIGLLLRPTALNSIKGICHRRLWYCTKQIRGIIDIRWRSDDGGFVGGRLWSVMVPVAGGVGRLRVGGGGVGRAACGGGCLVFAVSTVTVAFRLFSVAQTHMDGSFGDANVPSYPWCCTGSYFSNPLDKI